MRKIIVSELLTVDGLISAPDHRMNWAEEIMSDEMLQELTQQLCNVEILLLGRITYEIMQQYCTAPERMNDGNNIVHYLNGVDKLVFSKTMHLPEWSNTAILRKLNKRTIRNLQRQGNGNIVVMGSASIVQELINLDLVNEFHFFIHPLVLGEGKPLFRGISDRYTLTPVRTDVYKNGVLRLCYRAFN